MCFRMCFRECVSNFPFVLQKVDFYMPIDARLGILMNFQGKI